jgi:predicted small secreted protein
MRKAIYALVAIWYAVILNACHTMAGLGEDIEHGGQKIQNSAKQHQ